MEESFMHRYLPINRDNALQEHLLYQSVGFSIIPYIIEYDFERHDVMPIHWHNELQISWVYEGTLEFLIDGQPVQINSQDILFINGQVFHSSVALNGNAKTLCINFNLDFLHPKILEDYITPILNNTQFSYHVIPMMASFSKYFISLLNDIPLDQATCVKEIQSKNYFSTITLIHLLLEELILHFKGNDCLIQSNDFYIFKQLLSYIQIHFSDKIMIKDLLDHVHISKTYCNELFNKYTHMSPIQYLNTYRLQVAKDLIIHSSDTISEISERCGFNTSSYFSEQFRQHYQLSPLEFRKKFQVRV